MFCKRAQQQPRNMFLLLCIVFYWHTFSNGPHKVAILDRTPVCATPPLQATWHHEEKRAQTDLVCLCACLICLSTRNTATCFTNASGNLLRRATPTPACLRSLAHSLTLSLSAPACTVSIYAPLHAHSAAALLLLLLLLPPTTHNERSNFSFFVFVFISLLGHFAVTCTRVGAQQRGAPVDTHTHTHIKLYVGTFCCCCCCCCGVGLTRYANSFYAFSHCLCVYFIIRRKLLAIERV